MDAALKKRISEYFSHKPVVKAYLFGSRVGKNTDADSDFDILVELDHSSPVGLQFISMQLDLQELLNKEVDLLTPQSISKHIRECVDREKELIYER